MGIDHPFQAEFVDHCETSLEAYMDIAPFLDFLASQLGKNRTTLSIYDPYFCAGTMKKHLGSLGFHTVYNECEDFYGVIRDGRIPTHDVLVTNPPYSLTHLQSIIRFCNVHNKAYFLLLPDIFISKFKSILKATREADVGGNAAGESHSRRSPRIRRWKEGPVCFYPEMP